MTTVTYYAYEYDEAEKLVWSSYPTTGDFKDMSDVYDAAETLVKQLLANADEQGAPARFEVSQPFYDLEEVWNG